MLGVFLKNPEVLKVAATLAGPALSYALKSNPAKDKTLHMATEALAVYVAAPFLLYVSATNKNMATWQRVGLAGAI